QVFLGFDPFADRKVAIKVSVIHEQEDETTAQLYRKMFFNEAHMAGLLHHPNILSVYDAGVEGDFPYIVMEYVENAQTLKDFCTVNRLASIKEIVEIAFKCAKALDYAHRMGVIHRDIKPSNIMLTEQGDVKIGDFGIAKRTKSDTTQVLGMIGSPLYMSPEQAQEEEVSGQTDLFSLGIVTYELLTGRPPFKASRFSRLMYTIINDPPPPMRDLRSETPKNLEQIVLKTLEKNPVNRYNSCSDMAVELARTFEYLDTIESEIDEEEKFNGVKRLNFFQDFTDTETWEVIRAGVWEKYSTGDRIITEGNIEQAFYVIVEGDVIVKKAGRVLGTLESGDCFGEMGYLTKSERTATILSVNNVSTIKVNSTLIEQASISCQLKFNRVFLKTLITRLTTTNEILTRR
ncbi:MAG: protein kinase, partial [Gammaproteobacteria bacterium]|nr:protein kinase [Gammaproteobacteria bacterium]